jgi:transposase
MKHDKTLTKEEQAVEMAVKGASYREISEATGICYAKVYRIVRSAGLSRLVISKKRAAIKAKATEWTLRIMAGETQQDIATENKCTRSYVALIIRQNAPKGLLKDYEQYQKQKTKGKRAEKLARKEALIKKFKPIHVILGEADYECLKKAAALRKMDPEEFATAAIKLMLKRK